jgi:regulatory protein
MNNFVVKFIPVYKKWKKQTGRGEDEAPKIARDPDRARAEIMNRAIRLLTYKPRSVKELRERLLEKVWADEKTVDEVIEKLSSYGYVDDGRLALDLASSKLRQKAVGKIRLRQSLIRKKLDKETIDQAVEQAFTETPEAELIDRAIASRLKTRGKPESREDAKKFFDFLMRRGFNYELVREKMDKIAKNEMDD